MRREIKFRAKCSDTGEWVYGDLAHTVRITSEWDVLYVHCVRIANYNVDEDTIGQYLECSDKDGKPIYEHDIVEDADNVVGVVFCEDGDLWIGSYCNGFTGLRSFTAADSIHACDLRRWSVVGNIHDSPELLE